MNIDEIVYYEHKLGIYNDLHEKKKVKKNSVTEILKDVKNLCIEELEKEGQLPIGEPCH